MTKGRSDYIRKDIYAEYYKNIGQIFCPAFAQKVTFNAKGFKHITYLNGRHVRNETAKLMRFKLLPHAVKLVGITTTYQEFERDTQKIEVTHNNAKSMIEKDVTFWGLIAIIDERKIKVILRKVGNGNLHFWSIIPSWKTNKRDGKISMMKGNPQTD